MNRLLTNHTRDCSLSGVNLDALTNRIGEVVATNPAEIDVAIVIDIADLVANFIDMACEHNFREALRIDGCNHRAHRVGFDGICEGPNVAAEHGCIALFVATWGWRFNEFLQEIQCCIIHGVCP